MIYGAYARDSPGTVSRYLLIASAGSHTAPPPLLLSYRLDRSRSSMPAFSSLRIKCYLLFLFIFAGAHHTSFNHHFTINLEHKRPVEKYDVLLLWSGPIRFFPLSIFLLRTYHTSPTSNGCLLSMYRCPSWTSYVHYIALRIHPSIATISTTN